MKRLVGKAHVLARQLASHRGWLARRAASEVVGIAAHAAAGALVHTPLPPVAAARLEQAAIRRLPGYPEPLIRQANALLSAGRPADALIVAKRAAALCRARPEQPVLPTMAGSVLRRLGFSGISRTNLAQALTLVAKAAERSGDNPAWLAALDEASHLFGDVEAEIQALSARRYLGVLASSADRAAACVAQHPERPEAVELAVDALIAAGRCDQAADLACRYRSLHPHCAGVWRAAYSAYHAAGRRAQALECAGHLARIAEAAWPWVTLNCGLNELDRLSLLRVEAQVTAPTAVELGAVAQIVVRCKAITQGVVIIPAPVGLGLLPVQHSVSMQSGQATIMALARRASRSNAGRPWSIRAVVVGDGKVAECEVAISVADKAPGRFLHVVTDDHELHDGRARTPVAAVERLLVDKVVVALEIAQQSGAAFNLMVEACEVRLVQWAAERAPEAGWAKLNRRYRDLLVEAVARGHDVGLHLHTFYDPEVDHFSQRLDPDTGDLLSEPAFMFQPMAERPFWNRAHAHVGTWTDPHSKAGSLFRGLEVLESLGRLGDPAYRVALFRAGNYDFGKTDADMAASVFALRQAGLAADSDCVKGRLYHNFDRAGAFLCHRADIRKASTDARSAGVVQMPSEYNIEGDFLADTAAMRAYVQERIKSCKGPDGRVLPGVHVITTINHTKTINFRRGLNSDSLDPNYGDWATLSAHFGDLVEMGISPVPLRQAVDALVEDLSLEPWLVRDEEQIEPATGRQSTCWLRYPLRVLAAGGPSPAPLPAPGLLLRAQPPAFCARHALSWHIRQGGNTVVAADSGAFEPKDFFWDGQSELEMRVEVPIALGMKARRESSGGFRVTSDLPFRRANIWLNGDLRRNVQFKPTEQGGAVVIVDAD